MNVEIQKQQQNDTLGQMVERVFEDHTVRVQQDERGDAWFCAKDVCDAVGLADVSSALRGLDDDEKGPRIVRTLGGDQSMVHVCEPGLYSLLAKSRKPAAKRFDRWVRHDVLPAIRRTGQYVAPAQAPALPVPANDAVPFQVAHSILRLAGVSEGMAAASVLSDAEAHYGVRFDGARKALPRLEKPRADLNATALGKLIGVSAVEANKRLHAYGLQTKAANGEWALTDTGKAHGEAHEFVRHMANGGKRAGMQVLWFASAADVIREAP